MLSGVEALIVISRDNDTWRLQASLSVLDVVRTPRVKVSVVPASVRSSSGQHLAEVKTVAWIADPVSANPEAQTT